MISILRKNNKKIMAVLGVFLMIAFGWPTFRGRNAARSGSEVVGRIGSDTIYGVEYQNARGEWETLNKELRFFRPSRGSDGRQQFDSFSYAEWELIKRINAAYPQNPMVAVMGARRITSQIDGTTYMLLLREAGKMDVHPSRDSVQEALTALQGEVPGGDDVQRGRAHQAAEGGVDLGRNRRELERCGTRGALLELHHRARAAAVAGEVRRVRRLCVVGRPDPCDSSVGPERSQGPLDLGPEPGVSRAQRAAAEDQIE